MFEFMCTFAAVFVSIPKLRKQMKKLFLLLIFMGVCATVHPQGSVDMNLFVSGYANDGGITASVGQVFDAMAPEGVSISILTEGIQQGYSACNNLTEVLDIDGNSYPVVDLGQFCFTAKNLKTEHYADNSAIPDIRTYENDSYSSSDILDLFGHLYTWTAATQYNVAENQGICPTGWHIPTEAEMEYVMASYDPEELMSITYWIPPVGTDISNFTLFPSGCYNNASGRYEDLLVRAYLWTIKEEGTLSIACMFGSSCGTTEFVSSEKANGYSVRCVLNY